MFFLAHISMMFLTLKSLKIPSLTIRIDFDIDARSDIYIHYFMNHIRPILV